MAGEIDWDETPFGRRARELGRVFRGGKRDGEFLSSALWGIVVDWPGRYIGCCRSRFAPRSSADANVVSCFYIFRHVLFFHPDSRSQLNQ